MLTLLSGFDMELHIQHGVSDTDVKLISDGALKLV